MPNRQLAIVGVNGEEKTPEEMEAILAQRRANWKPKAPKYTKGLLKLYSQHAVSPMKVHIWSKNASFAIKSKNKNQLFSVALLNGPDKVTPKTKKRILLHL